MRKTRILPGPAPAPKRRRRRTRKVKTTIGWREWVGLPALGIEGIKAKIDTGARTAALHAWRVERFERDGQAWARFEVHPVQRDNRTRISCEARLVGMKAVRSSGGHLESRYVIVTDLTLGDKTWPIEVTLTNRRDMRFRMLLGRTALSGKALVDPRRSFLANA